MFFSLTNSIAHLGLSKYLPLFEMHAIRKDQLGSLSDDDLLSIGVEHAAHRQSILEGVVMLRNPVRLCFVFILGCQSCD